MARAQAQPSLPATSPQGVAPRVDISGARAPQMLPRVEPSQMWVYTHSIGGWTVIDGKVVPDLQRLTLQGGIGGCASFARIGSDGVMRTAYDFSAMRENRKNSGFSVLDPAVVGNYVRAHSVERGIAHCDQHERLIPGSPRTVWDRPAYVAWVLGLVEAGHIAPIMPHVLDEMITRTRRDLEKVGDEVATKPSLQSISDKLTRQLKALEAERARIAP